MDPDRSLAFFFLILSFLYHILLVTYERHFVMSDSYRIKNQDDIGYLARLPEVLKVRHVRDLLRSLILLSAVLSSFVAFSNLVSGLLGFAFLSLAIVMSIAIVQAIYSRFGLIDTAVARTGLILLWVPGLILIPFSWVFRISNKDSSPDADQKYSPEFREDQSISQEVVEVAMEDGIGEEDLDPDERRMIKSILKLDETTAREIMVPRMDMLAVESTSSLLEVAKVMWDSGHSRIPVYEETMDSIVGIIHSRDLLRHLPAPDTDVDITDIFRTPLFIPDSKRLDELLKDFQEKHIHLAIVVDEYGGTAGLVTIEDLLEEIVGEIEDEFDIPDSLNEVINENKALMDARIPLEEVNQFFLVNLEGEGFETLGGLLYQQLGKIPGTGDEIEVNGLSIKVVSTLGRRIKKVLVSRL